MQGHTWGEPQAHTGGGDAPPQASVSPLAQLRVPGLHACPSAGGLATRWALIAANRTAITAGSRIS